MERKHRHELMQLDLFRRRSMSPRCRDLPLELKQKVHQLVVHLMKQHRRNAQGRSSKRSVADE
jgi:hypothetical protein